MILSEFQKILDDMLSNETATFKAANQEYAHSADVLANFKRVAERISLTCEHCHKRTQITPEIVLMVYLEKHLDGIHAHNGGHESQREDVLGRIKDVRVYLPLLQALILERRQQEQDHAAQAHQVRVVEADHV